MTVLPLAFSLIAAMSGQALAQQIPDEDEPIVSDSQFEEALPPLDPALEAPLEPIETFELPTIDAEGPLPPVSQGAVPNAVAPAVPVFDPALQEPLAPLATFDVSVPEATTEVDPAAPEPVRFTFRTEGLEEVELQDRFQDLSALEDADGELTNGAQVAARAREDERLAVTILRSEGYYDGAAVATVTQLPDQPGQLDVVLTAAPGDQYKLGSIAVTGAPPEPTQIATKALDLESGDPTVATDIEAAEARVALQLPQQGYPFPEIGLRDIALDAATHTGDYVLPLNSGPKARFGGYRTEGDLAFDAEHVGVLARFERDELYDRRLVDDLREAMVATNLFDSVSAEPVLTGETAPDGTQYVDILVRQDAGPPRSIAANAGYNTGEGFRAEVSWEHRNLFPPEGALRVAAVGGTQEQSLGVQFRRTNAGRRDRTVSLTAEAARRDYDAYEAYTATLAGSISRVSTPIWQKVWTWSYGAELVATNEDRFDFDLGERDRATFFIGAVPLEIGYDRSDSLLDPTRGFRLKARTSPEVALQDGTRPYARTRIDGSAYYPVSDSLVIAGRAAFGTITGIDRDDLAPSRRYYGGGGGSVRGFGYQQLGPRDPNGDPLGGRSFNEFAIEARYRFGNFGIVPFIDAGQVYSGQFPKFGDMRFGAGIGGRLYTNFGPLRVDVATPLGRREGESRIAVYISIGQAF
ncbi:BamA/TamA family outer membrane protein [Allosphingosinicella flava]|uniref:BamA/TamA family outer membrane protein n=1 Tax=Allosphingosinicella flava TaxID=2771430 RepID=A0A7T2GLM2_9SPHN|nr:BamA/TamA family outer membrane protein [Sphingosinicella flava]QPQ56042.1 BamA/TamA family outer membrane protein [Sphingosinicella flava]